MARSAQQQEPRSFRIVDHEKLQHYKYRRAPWIKLHSDRLDDPRFGLLPDDTKAHLLLIECLVARTGNKLPFDEKFIRARINARKRINLQLLLDQGFIEIVASSTPADRARNARPEPEPEGEGERGQRAEAPETGPEAAIDPPLGERDFKRVPTDGGFEDPHDAKAIQAFVIWRDSFGKDGETLTSVRRDAIRAALAEHGLETVAAAIRGAALHPDEFRSKEGKVWDELPQLLKFPDRVQRWAKDWRDHEADEKANRRASPTSGSRPSRR